MKECDKKQLLSSEMLERLNSDEQLMVIVGGTGNAGEGTNVICPPINLVVCNKDCDPPKNTCTGIHYSTKCSGSTNAADCSGSTNDAPACI